MEISAYNEIQVDVHVEETHIRDQLKDSIAAQPLNAPLIEVETSTVLKERNFRTTKDADNFVPSIRRATSPKLQLATPEILLVRTVKNFLKSAVDGKMQLKTRPSVHLRRNTAKMANYVRRHLEPKMSLHSVTTKMSKYFNVQIEKKDL